MKKILVPVDFSAHTTASVKYAYHIAKAIGAEIILFHSFFDQIYFSDGGFSTGFESGMMLTDQIIRDFYHQKEEGLKRLADELIKEPAKIEGITIEVTTRIESGDPEVQIIQAIRQIDPVLIVMGSGGMGKKSMLSGSVARRIMNNAQTPVIAVPELKQIPVVRNVAYMTNFDPEDHQSILSLQSILGECHIHIFCLHLSQQKHHQAAVLQFQKLAGCEELKQLEHPISFHLLEATDIRQALTNFISTNKITLIAFIPHKRGIVKDLLYQGITKEDLFLTQTPVMAIQPGQ